MRQQQRRPAWPCSRRSCCRPDLNAKNSFDLRGENTMAIESPLLNASTAPAQQMRAAAATESSSAQRLLEHLLTSFLIRPKDWESLPGSLRDALRSHSDRQKLLAQLVEHKLLTEYQADRISAGK